MSRNSWLPGVRVLDFTTAWAGPAAGRFLGAFGADVVKVESARRYDLWRGGAMATATDAKGTRPYNLAPNFNGLNRNKRSVSLELTVPEGRAMFLRLVAAADAMVTNFSARVLPNLDLDYLTLNSLNPRLVLLNMPSLGATGPYRTLPGYGSIIEGLGGLAARFGSVAEGARVSQTFYPDAVAGIHAALALLAALRRRDREGHGCSIDLSQQETMWMHLGEGIVLSSLVGRDPERMGNAEPGRSPSGIFPTLDERWIAFVVKTDDQFRALVVAACPALDAFADWDGGQRIAGRQQLDASVLAWTAASPREDILRSLAAAGIRAAAVNNYADAASSPELARLDAFERVTHAEAGSKRYLRIPLRFDGQPVDTQRPGVRFGEHTDEVLHEWAGASPEEIDALRSLGAIVDEIPPGL